MKSLAHCCNVRGIKQRLEDKRIINIQRKVKLTRLYYSLQHFILYVPDFEKFAFMHAN